MERRTCTRCKRSLPVDLFALDRRKPDGLDYRCRACQAARFRAYRAENRLAVNARNAARARAIRTFLASLEIPS